jgi:hypothetical protein
MDSEDNKLDNSDPEQVGSLNKKDVDIVSLEIDMEHHIFIGGRHCIFLDYKHDPDHIKWIKKNHYPVFTSLKTLKRYWNPTLKPITEFFMGKKKISKKVIFRPPRPANGFAGAFQMLDDLADYGFRQGNMILFIDEIAPLVKATRIPDGLYDCLIMGAILFRLNLEDDRKKIKGIANQEVADALHNLPNTHFIYVRADGYHQTCRLKSD